MTISTEMPGNAEQDVNPTKSVEYILLVGGDPQLKQKISGMISHYQIRHVKGTRDALLQARRRPPTLILYDLGNPHPEDFLCLRRIKDDVKLCHIPIILLTEEQGAETRLKGLEAGADDYIPRPVNEKELNIKVRNLVKLHVQEQTLRALNLQLEKKIDEQLEIIIKNKRLTRFFPRKLVKWILAAEEDLELKGEKKRLTVFFSDLSGFTQLADQTPPEGVAELLNEYFSGMVQLVDRYEGTLDKFIGDGLMVFFGAPEAMDEREQALRAVSMAAAMQAHMRELTAKWKRQGVRHDIQIRMGVHQDLVMVGNFGSLEVMEYTVFGSGVNLANRLESYCEPKKILVIHAIYQHTRDFFPYKELKEQLFRGFERLVPVSELDPSDITEEIFKRVRAAFAENNFPQRLSDR